MICYNSFPNSQHSMTETSIYGTKGRTAYNNALINDFRGYEFVFVRSGDQSSSDFSRRPEEENREQELYGTNNNTYVESSRPSSIASAVYNSDVTEDSEGSRTNSTLPNEAELVNLSFDNVNIHSSPGVNHQNSSTYYVPSRDTQNWSVTESPSSAEHNPPLAFSPPVDPFATVRYSLSPRCDNALQPPDFSGLDLFTYTCPPKPPPPYRPRLQNSTPEQHTLLDLDSLRTEFKGRSTTPPPFSETTASAAPEGFLRDDWQIKPENAPPVTADSILPSVAELRDSLMQPPTGCGTLAAECGYEPGKSPRKRAFSDSDDVVGNVMVPADLKLWTKEDICRWLKWTERSLKIRPVDAMLMPEDGETLSRWTAEDLFQVTGDQKETETLLFHLDHMRQASGQSPVEMRNASTGYASTCEGRNFFKRNQEPPSVPAGESVQCPHSITEPEKDKIENYYKGNIKKPSSSKGGQVHLWQFIIELLMDPANHSLIQWEGMDGRFKLKDPEGVSKKWGLKKSKPNMNYDKLSRALRYYYDKGILVKVSGRRYTYKMNLEGVKKATEQTGVSDTCFLQKEFDENKEESRNFKLTP